MSFSDDGLTATTGAGSARKTEKARHAPAAVVVTTAAGEQPHLDAGGPPPARVWVKVRVERTTAMAPEPTSSSISLAQAPTAPGPAAPAKVSFTLRSKDMRALFIFMRFPPRVVSVAGPVSLFYHPAILRPLQWFRTAQLRLKAISKRHGPGRAGPAALRFGDMSISG
jgi:hypothetical protein